MITLHCCFFLKFDLKVQVNWHPSCGLLPLPRVPHPALLFPQRTFVYCQSFCQGTGRNDAGNSTILHCNICDKAAAPLHDVFGDICCCSETHHLSTVKKMNKNGKHIQQTHVQITLSPTLFPL